MIGQYVVRGGEMFWFHSVTVGGSVLCIRKNKLHIIWKVVNYFLRIKLKNFSSSFTLSFDEKKTNFCKTKWSVL